MDINKKLEELKVIPVVVLEDAKDAVPLAKALIDGGLPVAEVTFRTAAAADSIKAISEAYPDMFVGAGTVVDVEQAKRAIDAGASFLVSPGMNTKVIEFALASKVPVLPGACTPSEVMTAISYGIEVVKFFPAKQYGGLDTIKALAAPFPGVRFMPTGGINEKNIGEFLAFDKIIACGGSWMVKGDLVKAGKFDEITRLTKEAVALVNA